MGFRKSSSKRDIYSDTGLPQETRKFSNKESYRERSKQNIKLVEGKSHEKSEQK